MSFASPQQRGSDLTARQRGDLSSGRLTSGLTQRENGRCIGDSKTCEHSFSWAREQRI